MFMSRVQKRAVVVIAGMAFVLCQSAAIAQACLTMAPQPDAVATQQPCHGMPDQSGSQTDTGIQGGCQYASSALSGLDVFATTDLPAITVRIDRIIAVADSALPAEPPLLRIESPPLLVLHSRLRI